MPSLRTWRSSSSTIQMCIHPTSMEMKPSHKKHTWATTQSIPINLLRWRSMCRRIHWSRMRISSVLVSTKGTTSNIGQLCLISHKRMLIRWLLVACKLVSHWTQYRRVVPYMAFGIFSETSAGCLTYLGSRRKSSSSSRLGYLGVTWTSSWYLVFSRMPRPKPSLQWPHQSKHWERSNREASSK